MTEEQRVEAVRQKREMEALLETPGWKTFEAAIQAQIKYRIDEIMLNPDLDPMRSKYLAGEVAGIKTLLALPAGMVEMNDAVIKAAMQQEEGNENEGLE